MLICKLNRQDLSFGKSWIWNLDFLIRSLCDPLAGTCYHLPPGLICREGEPVPGPVTEPGSSVQAAETGVFSSAGFTVDRLAAVMPAPEPRVESALNHVFLYQFCRFLLPMLNHLTYSYLKDHICELFGKGMNVADLEG